MKQREMLKWKRQKASGAMQKSLNVNNANASRHEPLHRDNVAVYNIQNGVAKVQNDANVQHSFLTLRPQVITFDRGKSVSKRCGKM